MELDVPSSLYLYISFNRSLCDWSLRFFNIHVVVKENGVVFPLSSASWRQCHHRSASPRRLNPLYHKDSPIFFELDESVQLNITLLFLFHLRWSSSRNISFFFCFHETLCRHSSVSKERIQLPFHIFNVQIIDPWMTEGRQASTSIILKDLHRVCSATRDCCVQINGPVNCGAHTNRVQKHKSEPF